MNWLTKIKTFGDKIKRNLEKKFPTKEEQANSDWTALNCCTAGPKLKSELIENLMVCPNCSFHHYISPKERFNIHFGENNWQEIKAPIPVDDPLLWSDSKSYKDRLKSARKLTGQSSAVLSCKTQIKGVNLVASAIDFKFIGGSIASAEGENILQAVQTAIDNKCGYALFSASGGMRMMESLISLSQMTRMTIAINELKKNKLPFINIFCNPTAGGTTASISSLSDIAISERGATIAFSGKRVIQATIKEPLPEDFQTAEWAQRHGFCDLIIDREDIPKTLYSLLSILLKIDTEVKSENSNETSELNIQTREAS